MLLASCAGKMKRILRPDWLPEQVRWAYIYLLENSCFGPQEKNTYNYKSFIAQAYSVKIAGYWPCSLLLFHLPWRRLNQ